MITLPFRSYLITNPGKLLFVHIRKNQACTFAGKKQGRGPADAAGGAGYDGRFTAETSFHRLLLKKYLPYLS
jgi:hypothetical protein